MGSTVSTYIDTFDTEHVIGNHSVIKGAKLILDDKCDINEIKSQLYRMQNHEIISVETDNRDHVVDILNSALHISYVLLHIEYANNERPNIVIIKYRYV